MSKRRTDLHEFFTIGAEWTKNKLITFWGLPCLQYSNHPSNGLFLDKMARKRVELYGDSHETWYIDGDWHLLYR